MSGTSCMTVQEETLFTQNQPVRAQSRNIRLKHNKVEWKGSQANKVFSLFITMGHIEKEAVQVIVYLAKKCGFYMANKEGHVNGLEIPFVSSRLSNWFTSDKGQRKDPWAHLIGLQPTREQLLIIKPFFPITVARLAKERGIDISEQPVCYSQENVDILGMAKNIVATIGDEQSSKLIEALRLVQESGVDALDRIAELVKEDTSLLETAMRFKGSIVANQSKEVH